MWGNLRELFRHRLDTLGRLDAAIGSALAAGGSPDGVPVRLPSHDWHLVRCLAADELRDYDADIAEGQVGGTSWLFRMGALRRLGAEISHALGGDREPDPAVALPADAWKDVAAHLLKGIAQIGASPSAREAADFLVNLTRAVSAIEKALGEEDEDGAPPT
jgi:hypothetical protein